MCVCAYPLCSHWLWLTSETIWCEVGRSRELERNEEMKWCTGGILREARRRWDRMGMDENKRCDTVKVWMGHSAVVLTVIVHSSLKCVTEEKTRESLMSDGLLLFSHRPLWSWLCCLYCSSILWGLEELYTPPPPYTAASDTTTFGLQWRLEEESKAHIQF